MIYCPQKKVGKPHSLRLNLGCAYLRTACTNPRGIGCEGASRRTSSAGFASWEVPVGAVLGGVVLGLRAGARPGGWLAVVLSWVPVPDSVLLTG